MHNQEHILENDTRKLHRDFEIETDTLFRRNYHIVNNNNKKKKERYIEDCQSRCVTE